MTIAASKVKAICSASEIKLVRASRKGEIEKLSPAEVKRFAAQAKKLADKWRSLGRGQARSRNRKVGFGEAAANTQLKSQIFGDALAAFETKRAELEKSVDSSAKQSPIKSKKDRTTEHRTVRAGIRKGMAAAEDLLNTAKQAKKKAKVASKTSEPKPEPIAEPPAQKKSVARQRPPLKPVPTAKRTPQVVVDPLHQQAAVASAKQSRIIRSGRTTRMAGHAGARVRRAQARRDAKN
jgi:hypothetical protein